MTSSECNYKVFERMINMEWVMCLSMLGTEKLIITVIDMLNIYLISTVKVTVFVVCSVEFKQWHAGAVSYRLLGLTVKISRLDC